MTEESRVTEWEKPPPERHVDVLAGYAAFVHAADAVGQGDAECAADLHRLGEELCGPYWPWAVVMAAQAAALTFPLEELGIAELGKIIVEMADSWNAEGDARAATIEIRGGVLARVLYVGSLAVGAQGDLGSFGVAALALIRDTGVTAGHVALRDLAMLGILGASAMLQVRQPQ